jgi:hypothetical protein
VNEANLNPDPDVLDSLAEMGEFGGISPASSDSVAKRAVPDIDSIPVGETLTTEDGWKYHRHSRGVLFILAPARRVIGRRTCPVCTTETTITEGMDPEHCGSCAVKRALSGWTINGHAFPAFPPESKETPDDER